jgi:osmotically-inducible protein OsmY
VNRTPSLTIALCLAVCAATTLPGCGAFVIAGATYGAAVAYDRRAADVVIDDEVIELQARDAFYKNPDISGGSSLKVTSYAHTALITGQAEDAQIADRYARIVAQLPKVKQVFNEAEIGPRLTVGQRATDTMIGSRSKLAIQSVKLPGFDALRVKVVVEHGVVYLLGLVTPEEGDATAEKVRRVPNVVRVVKLFEYIAPRRGDGDGDGDDDERA